ncbi:MAG: hypothetical protein GXO82_08120 [Chlorobi bacterium]|nr:hypothetical protein [Chlorobiota bacterium]
MPNLDLFHTAYMVIESPRRIFATIARSEQKNYVYLLFSLTGFGLAGLALWLARAGEHSTNFAFLLITLVWSGPLAGLVGFSLAAVIFKTFFRSPYDAITYRQAAALLAYALVPLAASVAFIFPVELAVFGKVLFSFDPSPYAYKPIAFLILAGLDALAALWSIALVLVAFRTVYGVPYPRLIGGMVMALFAILCIIYGESLVIRSLP